MCIRRIDSLWASLLLCGIALSGCQFYTASVPASDYYYLNPTKDLYDVGSVAIVEMENNSSYPAIGSDMTQALFLALQKKQIFSLLVVRQDDPSWRSLQPAPSGASNGERDGSTATAKYSPEQLSTIRKTLNCNGLFTGTVTRYQPYPHMVLGLRLKLVDLRDGRLLWAAEQIWDAADKATAKRIKQYSGRQMPSDVSALREQLVTVSPLGFIDFVAYEVARTLDGDSGQWHVAVLGYGR